MDVRTSSRRSAARKRTEFDEVFRILFTPDEAHLTRVIHRNCDHAIETCLIFDDFGRFLTEKRVLDTLPQLYKR